MDTNLDTKTTTRLLVSKKEAAEALCLCVRSIDNLISSKQLSVVRVGKRVLVKHASLIAFCRHDHATRSSAGSAEVQ